VSRHIFQTFKIVKIVVKVYDKKIFSMDSSLCRCRPTLYADNRRDPVKRTRETAAGAILIDMHASVAT